MRRINLIIAAAALLPLLALSACAGLHARNKALLPAMATAYVNGQYSNKGIYWDIRKGIDAVERTPVAKRELRLLADDLGAALKGDDYVRVMRVDWPRLASVAELGISARVIAGEIGDGVAASYRERVRLFGESFRLLGAR